MYTPLKDDNLLLYCRSGNRSALATQTLQNLGFSNVRSLDKGFLEWKKTFPKQILSSLPVIQQSGSAPIAQDDDAGGC